jgi:hypothetical protein
MQPTVRILAIAVSVIAAAVLTYYIVDALADTYTGQLARLFRKI